MERMIWLWAILLTVSGCAGLKGIGLLGGGGPNVASNAQLGQNNTQAGVTNTSSYEGVEQVIVNNTDIVLTLILVLIAVLGWVLPTPSTMWQKVWKK